MRTPAGTECPYFYGDYYRGRSVEECRLLSANPSAGQWTSDLCQTCPVPGIRRANACENMTLYAAVRKGFLRTKKMVITAYCSQSKSEVKTPEIGCALCHQDVDIRSKK